MIKYYVDYYKTLIPCYLIKEGYLPCYDYDTFLKNGKDMYNNGYCVEDYCVAHVSDSKNIFTDLKEAKEIIRKEIKESFQISLEYLIEERERSLKILENVK